MNVKNPDIDDTELLINRYSEVCTFCKHLKGERTCSAFPGGIPAEIWIGKNKHKRPFPGDKGIRFEKL